MPILAVRFPVFQRSMRIIETITNGFPAEVTTTFPHQYQDGLIVRLVIPAGFGMQAANKAKGPIKVTGSNTFLIDVDTTNLEPFIYPSNYPENQQYAQVVPIGQINSQLSQSTQNVLPYPAI